MNAGHLVYMRPFPAAGRVAAVYCKTHWQSQSHYYFSRLKLSSVVLGIGVVAFVSSSLLSLR